ncbi:aminotransferase [Microbispora rosea subsp. aerata]|nr:type 1 glutamine amidotransferase [Microbispora rosea]GGO09605.1 aminotransferase [Microbispora rosea subsp. aerata]GIH53446.1 aminotransferase [Microbispora rosea subsp. aerata]GLJ83128.1 aminotransferase [Microbispora rosea subsp. aerata]
MRKRLTVIEHEAGAGLGFFSGWLEAAGVETEVVRPYKGEPVPGRAPGGLLVLGGAPSAWDDEACGWLPATRDLLARAVDEGVPTLGICLGAQLMTLACGGAVERGAAGLEIGLGEIEPLPEAAADPLLSALPAGPVRAIQYHYDAMTTLPEGAVRLAAGRQYPNQAYRLGDRAWAVQFHPEATPAIFASWTGEGELPPELSPERAAELNARVEAAEDELRRTWKPLAEAFAAQLTG